ncbi:MAG: nicotinate phosphoribosyltransferase [Phycisphaerae bacterium]|nr:nicotinate phosphoribosyltransferase [Phycisphaerae bacterium]
MLRELYGHSLALLTDLYELTMAQGYWNLGMADREASFHVSFRANPFGGGYTIACGLAQVVEYVESFGFDASDTDLLAQITGNDGERIFSDDFLTHLRQLRPNVAIDAVAEGDVVLPHEPLLRVTGPLVDCQILETALLNILNFQSLIATKAARICTTAGSEPVLEFGLRRAQGIDGGISASRAAYVGGCAGTSNALAGKLLGIPVKGTHAHSWVMLFDDEPQAFNAYAEALPNNGIFLVDTYNTLRGVRHAIETAHRLRDRGHAMIGIRLDSGDLAWLSREARAMLDEAGLSDAKIVASGDVDEHVIESLHEQGAAIDLWGVGTRLATGYDEPALGGVYKLSAVREGDTWRPRIKLSEQLAKVSTPGRLRVRRYVSDGEALGDAIYDEDIGIGDGVTIVDPADPTRRKDLPADADQRELLVPVFRNGRRVYDVPPLEAARDRCGDELGRFHAGIKRLMNPHSYPAGLERNLHERKTEMILDVRRRSKG